jgi:hypothetical protein
VQRVRLPLLRKLVHVAVVTIGWILFVWAWARVLTGPAADWRPAVLLILGGLIAFPVATSAWVQHCRNVFRRKGPRGPTPLRPLDYSRDWNGQRVHGDWGALQSATRIVVHSDGKDKRCHVRAASTSLPIDPGQGGL